MSGVEAMTPQEIAERINAVRAEQGLPAINARVGLGGAILSDAAKRDADVHPETLGERIVRALEVAGEPMGILALTAVLGRDAYPVETALRALMKRGVVDALMGISPVRYFLKRAQPECAGQAHEARASARPQRPANVSERNSREGLEGKIP